MSRDYHAGDLLFFAGSDLVSRIIEYGQWPPFVWGPSHVGIIIEYNKDKLLVESTTLCALPCAIEKKLVSGVQAHKPHDRIRIYKGQVYHCAIQERERLDRGQRMLLEQIIMRHFIGKPYDMEGAIESANPWISMFCGFPDMGALFCSAFCAYLLQRLGKMDRDNPKKYSPEKLRRTVLRNATHKPLVRIE